MTTRRIHRCQHCRAEYTYTASTYGEEFPSFNDSRWCADCCRVVREALKNVPRKFERVDAPADGVSLSQVLAWEAEHEARIASGAVLPIRRVSMPLFQMNGRSVGGSDRSGYVRSPDGVQYHYRFWPGQESEAVITREMEREIATGTLRPWVARRNDD